MKDRFILCFYLLIDFNEILMTLLLGNEPVKKRLTQLIEQNRVPHLLLFSGPDGVGKKLFAKWFARKFLERHCGRTLSSHCPDISLVAPEGKTGMHSIASIRRCQEEIFLAPFEAGGKVLIVDDAERMLPVCSNTLLKTLEEPPANCVIILVTSCKNRMLNTIVSRCQEIRFGRCSYEEVLAFLHAHHAATEHDLEHIARSSFGSIGGALRVCEKSLDDVHKMLFEFLQSGKWRHFAAVSDVASAIQKGLEEKKKGKSEALWLAVKQDMKEYSSGQKHILEQEIEGALSVSWMQDVREVLHDIVAYFRDLNCLEVGENHPALYFSEHKSELVEAYNERQKLGQKISLDHVDALMQRSMQALERQTALQYVLETFFSHLI